MLKRTITGLIILIAVAGFVLLRLVSPYFFDGFTLLIIYACLTEFALSCKFSNKKLSSVLLFIYPILLMLIYIFSTSFSMCLLLQLALLLLMFVLLMVKELIQNAIKRKHNETEENNQKLLSETKDTLEVMIYPAAILGFLFGINHFGLNIGFIGLILTFAITMTTDVFAFLFGKMIKGPKFAPEISPNKTISGMAFGALGGMVAAAVSYVLFVHLGLLGDVFSSVSQSKAIALFVLLGVVGTFLTQFGDLVESAYKRKVGIKDFGAILPGHGGVMDRVDGLMFTGALVYVLFALFMF